MCFSQKQRINSCQTLNDSQQSNISAHMLLLLMRYCVKKKPDIPYYSQLTQFIILGTLAVASKSTKYDAPIMEQEFSISLLENESYTSLSV